MTSLPVTLSTLTAKKVHEDEILERQDVLHFLEESKDYEYSKFSDMRQAL